MATTKINCLNCNKETYVENKEIKRGYGKFCSRLCSAQFNGAARPKPEPNVSCGLCQKVFYMNETKKKNSKSGFHFCCREHKDLAQRLGGIKEIMPAHYGTANHMNHYRELVFHIHKKEKKCNRCGYDKHPAGIEVHHIDRNRSNNDISNLEVICAICHRIEHYGEEY